MDNPTFKILIEARPNIGAETSEPSLETIVLKYYAAHFPSEEAALQTVDYFAALKRHVG